MIISYTISYKPICKGKDWVLFSRLTFKDTLIMWALYRIVTNGKSFTFDQIKEELQAYYKVKVERSNATISVNENYVEIYAPNMKGFPKFRVVKKDFKE